MNRTFLNNLKTGALLIAIPGGIGFMLNYFYDTDAQWDSPSVSPSSESADAKALGEIVTADEVEQLIRQKANVLILDVRADWFYENDGHLPGAVNLERGEFAKLYPPLAAQLRKADRVIVYCSDYHCADSKAIAAKLRELKHENISLYSGGWEEWKSQKRKFNTGKTP
jgi:3-mercaptopyruvate sulfurtransferase SseA